MEGKKYFERMYNWELTKDEIETLFWGEDEQQKIIEELEKLRPTNVWGNENIMFDIRGEHRVYGKSLEDYYRFNPNEWIYPRTTQESFNPLEDLWIGRGEYKNVFDYSTTMTPVLRDINITSHQSIVRVKVRYPLGGESNMDTLELFEQIDKMFVGEYTVVVSPEFLGGMRVPRALEDWCSKHVRVSVAVPREYIVYIFPQD